MYYNVDIHPVVQRLIESLDATVEYAITRDLVAHKITRAGHTVPDSPVVFYDKETGTEIGLAYGDDYIRVNTNDVGRLRAAVRSGQTGSVRARETIKSLNAQAYAGAPGT